MRWVRTQVDTCHLSDLRDHSCQPGKMNYARGPRGSLPSLCNGALNFTHVAFFAPLWIARNQCLVNVQFKSGLIDVHGILAIVFFETEAGQMRVSGWVTQYACLCFAAGTIKSSIVGKGAVSQQQTSITGQGPVSAWAIMYYWLTETQSIVCKQLQIARMNEAAVRHTRKIQLTPRVRSVRLHSARTHMLVLRRTQEDKLGWHTALHARDCAAVASDLQHSRLTGACFTPVAP